MSDNQISILVFHHDGNHLSIKRLSLQHCEMLTKLSGSHLQVRYHLQHKNIPVDANMECGEGGEVIECSEGGKVKVICQVVLPPLYSYCFFDRSFPNNLHDRCHNYCLHKTHGASIQGHFIICLHTITICYSSKTDLFLSHHLPIYLVWEQHYPLR